MVYLPSGLVSNSSYSSIAPTGSRRRMTASASSTRRWRTSRRTVRSCCATRRRVLGRSDRSQWHGPRWWSSPTRRTRSRTTAPGCTATRSPTRGSTTTTEIWERDPNGHGFVEVPSPTVSRCRGWPGTTSPIGRHRRRLRLHLHDPDRRRGDARYRYNLGLLTPPTRRPDHGVAASLPANGEPYLDDQGEPLVTLQTVPILATCSGTAFSARCGTSRRWRRR